MEIGMVLGDPQILCHETRGVGLWASWKTSTKSTHCMGQATYNYPVLLLIWIIKNPAEPNVTNSALSGRIGFQTEVLHTPITNTDRHHLVSKRHIYLKISYMLNVHSDQLLQNSGTAVVKAWDRGSLIVGQGHCNKPWKPWRFTDQQQVKELAVQIVFMCCSNMTLLKEQYATDRSNI